MLSQFQPESLEVSPMKSLRRVLEFLRHGLAIQGVFKICTAPGDALVECVGPKGVDPLPTDRSVGALLRAVHEVLVVLGEWLMRGGHLDLDGRRIERGEPGLAAVELLRLYPLGVLEDKTEGRIEGADAVDLGQGPSVLLENLGLGLATGKNALDGVNELLFGLVILVQLLVVGAFIDGGGSFAYLVRKES